MSDQNNEGTDPAATSDQQATSVQNRLIEHVKSNKIDCGLWLTRMLTIFFAIGYIIPIFG